MVTVLESIRQETKTLSKRAQVDNGSEFICKTLEEWVEHNTVEPEFSTFDLS